MILLTVDTLRADHVLRNKVGVSLTPNLERLAARSITFQNASSAACQTSPGIAAILTGLLPRRSGVIHNGHTITSGVPTLGTLLAAKGVKTAAFIGNPVIGTGFGFERGFEIHHLNFVKRQRRAPDDPTLTDSALEWMEGVADDDQCLLWVHYMDPHGPYIPPREHLELFPFASFEAEEDIPLSEDDRGWGAIPRYQQRKNPRVQDGRDYLARYAAEVRFMDSKLGRLVEELDRRGWLEHSILVVTADHGEALAGDHGWYFSHGNGVTQDQIHVPLLLYYPGCEGGRVVERPVSTVDIVPTIRELLDLAPLPLLDGHSLLSTEATFVVSQSVHVSSVREGDWKLTMKRGGQVRLVNLANDPDGEEDLALANEARVAELTGVLKELEARPIVAQPVSRDDPTPAAAEQLEALGYGGDDED